MSDRKSFMVNGNAGFQIKFPNGLVLSTQFGPGHYCENRDFNLDSFYDGKVKDNSSNTVEIAVFFDTAGDWKTKEVYKKLGIEQYDDVVGWVTMEEWLQVFEARKNY